MAKRNKRSAASLAPGELRRVGEDYSRKMHDIDTCHGCEAGGMVAQGKCYGRWGKVEESIGSPVARRCVYTGTEGVV